MISVSSSLNFSSRVTCNSSLQCSDEYQLTLSTEDGIFIVTPFCDLYQKTDDLVFHQSVVSPSDEICEFDVGVNRTTLEKTLPRDDLYELMLDRTLSPMIQSTQSFKGFREAKWSPLGADVQGRCVLATLSMDHSLCLYSPCCTPKKWKKVAAISELLHSEFRAAEFRELNERINKYRNEKKQFQTIKQRTEALAAVTLDWSALLYSSSVPCEESQDEPPTKRAMLSNEVTTTHSLFAVLAVAVKSGHVMLWKVQYPVAGSCSISLMESFDAGERMPSSICWCDLDDNTGLVGLGCIDGTIRLVELCRDNNSQDLVVTRWHKLWTDRDKLAVVAAVWWKERNILLTIKGPHVFMFEVLLENGRVEKIVSGHTLVGDGGFLNSLSVQNDRVVVMTNETSFYSGIVVHHASKEELCFEYEVVTINRDPGATKAHGLCFSPCGMYLIFAISPASYYCHLSVKRPLKISLVPWLTNDAAVTRLLNGEGSMSKYTDILCHLGQQFSQTQEWPPLLLPLVSKKEGWDELRPFQLQLLRIVFLLRLARLPKCTSEDDKKPLSTDIRLLEKLMMLKHAEAALQLFMAEDINCRDLVESERICLLHLASCLKTSEQSRTHSVIDAARDKLGLVTTSLSEERCRICQSSIAFNDFRQDVCTGGHSFGRCCQTLLLCQEVPSRKCKVCHAVAIRKYNTTSTWFAQLQTNDCQFCGFQMT